MEPHEIARLIHKQFEGTLNEQEQRKLSSWIDAEDSRRSLMEKLHGDQALLPQVLAWLELLESDVHPWQDRLVEQTRNKLRGNRGGGVFQRVGGQYRLGIACLVLIAVTAGWWFGKPFTSQHADSSPSAGHVGDADRLHVTLTLPQGQQIRLDQKQKQIVWHRDGAIRYPDGQQLVPRHQQLSAPSASYILRVPKGKTYEIKLPDRSIAWVNADSELRIAQNFARNNRSVFLSGEAFFDVQTQAYGAHKLPFSVRTKDQLIQVTGTEFNVTAFPDEGFTKTTLIDGHVHIQAGDDTLQLERGEQAVFSTTGLSKEKVEVSAYIAWKTNRFHFDQTPLDAVMTQLGRWYDVDIHCSPELASIPCYGTFERDQPLDSVLAILQEAGIKFQINRDGNNHQLTALPDPNK